MSYIGSTPTTQSFIAGTDYFNGDGSTVAFTLSRSVVSVNDIEAVINNVEQQPNTAYTVSGTTITFTSAPSAGTGNIYVRYLSTTTQSITPSQNTVSYSTLNSDNQSKLGISFKNRVINGAMTVSQRYGTTSTAATSPEFYSLDRWGGGYYGGGTGRYTVQQVSDAPAGFVNSALITTTTAESSTTANYGYIFHQFIEGFNTADLNWGTANAQTVTLSFWVKSSLTGTFPIIIQNYDTLRTYGATYTISAANTWTKASITIAGDTTGTWYTNNSGGVTLQFGLGGGGSIRTATLGWQAGSAGNQCWVAGSTSVIATSGATWNITGVQFEVGTQATTFDYRSYGTELALCQRYCYALTASTGGTVAGSYIASSATGANWTIQFPVQARVAPTGVTSVGNWYLNNYGPGSAGVGSLAFIAGTTGTITLASNGNVVSGGGQTVGVGGSVTAYGGSATLYTTGSEL